VGAALVWAVDVDIPYVYDAALGWILLVGGIATVVGAVAMNRPVTRRRQVVYRS
jgi:predicted MFS family arabinose efflux permease